MGVGPCLFFFFFTTTLLVQRYKKSEYTGCQDLFGLGGFDKFWRVEEVVEEVLHTLQALLVGESFPVPLVRHLRCCFPNLIQS